jgi:aminoglycoside phosphotransferase (APT) family kinase protein
MHTPAYISDISDDGRRIGFIETFLPGASMGKYSPVGGRTILQAIASAGAATHQLEPQDFDHLPSYANRREHVVSMLSQITENTLEQFPETRQAKARIENHLPPEVPCSVLHGDLLPQNLLVIFDFESPTSMPHSAEDGKLLPSQIGVVDWQTAKIGSPAYDLAIVTRGKRKIGKGMGGRGALLNTYLNAGGQATKENEIINFELLLFMNWIQDALLGDPDTSPPEHHAQMLAGFLKRLS